jgi:hypothetical protein
MAKESPFKIAHDFEKRTREYLEQDMMFPWNRYFPWFFLGDLVIVAVIARILVWWWQR